MIQVIIDTNILDQSPHRTRAEFQALQKLCDNKQIQLHLPEIVQQEFLSHREETIKEEIQAIARGIRTLKREKVTKQARFSERLDSWENNLDELKTQLIEAIHEEFTQWKDGLNIQLHGVASHHGRAVVQAYFKGELPFRGVRNKGTPTQKEGRSRVEFADAFIWQTVLDILNQHKRIHFISNNTKDFDKLSKATKGVILHPSLEAFLLSREVQDLFLEQFTKQNFETILAVLKEKESHFLPKLVHEVYEGPFDSVDYFFEDLIGPAADVSEWSYDAERDWKIEVQYDKVKHYGYGLISLPFVIKIEDFTLFYSREIHTGSQSLPPNTEVRSPFNLGESVTLYTRDHFPLKLYISAQMDLSTRTIDTPRVGEGPGVEDIPDIIDQAYISLDQIDEVEVDETKRKQYNTVH